MLSLHGKHGVVISRIPVMQNGLGKVRISHQTQKNAYVSD